jgi:glucosamine--fructose-6-phosphate aminotransferase (isomerizing)
VVVAPQDKHHKKMLSNVEEVKARSGFIIGIGQERDQEFAALCDIYIPCPQNADEALQGVLSVIPLQLLSYTVALLRGTDIDQPRNLAKSVTVE